MTKIKNRTSKFVTLSIIFLSTFMLSLNFTGNKVVSVSAKETERLFLDEKVYSNTSLDDDFDDSSVLVVMDKRFGGINKYHESSFFGNFPKTSIEDLTYIDENTYSRKYLDELNFRQILQIRLPIRSKENVLHVIAQLQKIEGIKWAGPNHYDRINAQPTAAGGTRYGGQWGLHGEFGIDAERAWDFTIGRTVPNRVRVGIMDTGLNAHADLNANIVVGGDFLPENMPNATTPGILRDDINGHGTRVAGIVGATGANINGVSGVAQNVSLVPMQVATADNQGLNVAAVARAITWAATNDVAILNYSGGAVGGSGTHFDARRAAIEGYAGLLVCSAGNGGINADQTPHFPSDYSDETNNDYSVFSDRVISVGSILETGVRNNTSNYGAHSVSLFAPGNQNPTTLRTGGYGVISQTSGAAPHVSGVAALMLSINPNLTAAQLKSTILNNVDLDDRYTNDPTNGRLCVSGGRLNSFKAVASVAMTSVPNSSNNSQCTITGVANGFNLTGSITIPELINGRTVTQIGASSFSGQNQLTQITIPSTVTTIGSNAFKNTNNARIDLEGRTSSPSTFDPNWNPSNNPVFLNGVECHHTSKTLTYLSDNSHGLMCDLCRTTTNVTAHPETKLWVDYKMHRTTCSCGINYLSGHVVSLYDTGFPYKTCLSCGGPAKIYNAIDRVNPIMGTALISQYFGSGSYLLPNGVYVLSGADLEDFYAGTLVLPEPCEECHNHFELHDCGDCLYH